MTSKRLLPRRPIAQRRRRRRFADGYAFLTIGLAILWCLHEYTPAPPWLLGGLGIAGLIVLYRYDMRTDD